MAAGLARAAIKADAKEVIIISSDSDFAQLVNGPVKIHDINKSCLLENKVCSTRKLRFYVNTRRRQS
jgi:5'-3' exonuclease